MLFLLAVISVSAHFEGGNIGKVEHLSPTHLRCSLVGQADQDGRNRQANWYYFRIDGAKNRELILDLVSLPGEYNYQPNRGAVTKDTVPVFSTDNLKWTFADRVEFDAAEPRLRIFVKPTSDKFWIAHTPPYTNQHLSRLMRNARRNPAFKVEEIGRSVHHRPLYVWTITNPEIPEAEKKVIWLMARQHSWETFTSWVAEGAVQFLLSDSTNAKRLRNQAIWKILPAADPDGMAAGGVRYNANGYDLNRNWDVSNPRAMPEVTAQKSAILKWVDAGHALHLFLSMHNTETAEYLEGPPDEDGRFLTLGRKLFELLKSKTTFSPSRELSYASRTTTEGKPGRMTVVQGLWQVRQLPAFLTEQRVSAQPGSLRLLSVEDRIKYGQQLAEVMYESVSTVGQ